MKSEVGVWIDHREAVIATIAGKTEATRHVASHMPKHARHAGAAQEGAPESQKHRQFTRRLDKYYSDVIACIRDAGSILLLGPGEAKVELKERLGKELLGDRIVGIDTVEKMTDNQVAAAVRERFSKTKRTIKPTRPV